MCTIMSENVQADKSSVTFSLIIAQTIFVVATCQNLSDKLSWQFMMFPSLLKLILKKKTFVK